MRGRHCDRLRAVALGGWRESGAITAAFRGADCAPNAGAEKLIDDQILMHPGEAALYRLRARLRGAGYDMVEAWEDWRRVVELAPNDLLAHLEVERMQHRSALVIAGTVMGMDGVPGDDPVYEAKVAELRQQAFVSRIFLFALPIVWASRKSQ
jgi:hypothetical protein